MDVAIIGTGHVGLVAAACLATLGHRVIGVDDDPAKIVTLEAGGMPFYEPHLEMLVERHRAEGRLRFTHRIEAGVAAAEIVFICVGTPALTNGEADLSAVERVARGIAETANTDKLVVEKSTVPVQTGRWIARTLALYNGGRVHCEVASNPEFLREGSAVKDFLHPDRLVLGVNSPWAAERLRALYAPLLAGNFRCPVHQMCQPHSPLPVLVTSIESAELIKHASNAFLAMKISFANALADLCERTGADVTEVVEGVGLDQRIGHHFLNAGIGFGGYCFPKDLQAFMRIAEGLGYDFALLREVERINQGRPAVVLKKLKAHLWQVRGKRIGVWGLAFKPDTDDIREAPALRIIELLLQEGAEVQVYDPKAMENAQAVLQGVTFCQDPFAAAEGVEALILATEWEEFKELDLSRVKARMKLPLLIDGRNFFDKEVIHQLGFEYHGIGR